MSSAFSLVLSEYLVDICMTRPNVECLCPRDFKLYWRVLVRIMRNVLHWLPEITKKRYHINVRSRYARLLFPIARKVVPSRSNLVYFYDFSAWRRKCCSSAPKHSSLIGKNYHNITHPFHDNTKVFANFLLISTK